MVEPVLPALLGRLVEVAVGLEEDGLGDLQPLALERPSGLARWYLSRDRSREVSAYDQCTRYPFFVMFLSSNFIARTFLPPKAWEIKLHSFWLWIGGMIRFRG